MLRSEIFINEDRQLRATHLILDYKPISRIFQDAGQALRADSSRLARIDVSKPRFLARKDLPPVQLPIQHVPQEVTIPRKETIFVQLSLEAKIDQFHLEDEEGVVERPVELLDSEIELDYLSVARLPDLTAANVGANSEEEEEEEEEEEGMDLKPRTSLRGLMANRNKGSTSKEVPKAQVPASLPPPPPQLPADLRLKVIPDLRKKRQVEDLEKGELGPQKGAKQQKKAKEPKDKRTKSVESRDEAELCQGQ